MSNLAQLYQRVTIPVITTSDHFGNAIFTIGPCPLGSVWEGTVSITNAPATGKFNLQVLDINWGTFFGQGPYGPLQIYGQETLTINASNLAPSTQYAARFIGLSAPEDLIIPSWPAALTSPNSQVNTILFAGNVLTASTAQTIINNLDVSQWDSIILEVQNASLAHIKFTVFWLTPNVLPTINIQENLYSTAGLNMNQVLFTKGQTIQININANASPIGCSFQIIGRRNPTNPWSWPSNLTSQYVFNIGNPLVVAASSNSALILPTFDYTGPVTVAGVLDLSVVGNNSAYIDITDWDETDTQIIAVTSRITGTPWPNTQAHIYIQPQRFWLSRYRHKIQINNTLNAGGSLNSFVAVIPEV